ncbi:MAG: sigma-54 dependent transcriptional regulator, partial [Paramuribaculum sp.]|nr:sigma-54 dependent transcriptional regulator [Paramuribaculum sp.]
DTFSDPATVSAHDLTDTSAVLLDMNFKSAVNNGNEGFYWLARFKRIAPDIPVILITAYAEIDLAVRGIKEGASDFIVKPWDNERLVKTIESLLKKDNQHDKPASLSSSMIWGKSTQMSNLFETITKSAPTSANILIVGENGTGKGLLAEEIHRRSVRAAKPMYSVDVGAIPETLFESELFGYVKGAFTGATATRPGKIEDASGSTLFLDEITNLPLHLQSKLLTVLQSRKVTRLGDNKAIPVDIRLICATNRNISEMVSSGHFREDLFYRINTIIVTLLPLRERPEDIPELANAFAQEFGEIYDKPEIIIDSSGMDKLCRYPFPGNIRQLKHTIEKAVILSDDNVLTDKSFSFEDAPVHFTISNIGTIAEMEKRMIETAMIECGGNLSEVASRLGITRQTLYNKIKRMGI